MRKLAAILILMMVAIISIADNDLGSMESNYYTITYKKWAVDYTLTNGVAQTFTVDAAKSYPSTQSLTLNFDKVSGSHDVTVVLYGRCFSGDDWVQIATGSTGTISTTYDLTITNTVPNRYREFKWVATGTGTAVTTIDSQEFKLFLE